MGKKGFLNLWIFYSMELTCYTSFRFIWIYVVERRRNWQLKKMDPIKSERFVAWWHISFLSLLIIRLRNGYGIEWILWVQNIVYKPSSCSIWVIQDLFRRNCCLSCTFRLDLICYSEEWCDMMYSSCFKAWLSLFHSASSRTCNFKLFIFLVLNKGKGVAIDMGLMKRCKFNYVRFLVLDKGR